MPRPAMNLKEPRKKKRVRLQSQPPLPIDFDENGDWTIYTAHLSASGTCIVDPDEMKAVYSMGFFGKGSLSRSFPSFDKRRDGIPPIARNRQWIRRQKWLEELQSLNENNGPESSERLETTNGDGSNPNSSTQFSQTDCNLIRANENNSPIETNSNEPCRKKLKVDDPSSVQDEQEKEKARAEVEEIKNSGKEISFVSEELALVIDNQQEESTARVETADDEPMTETNSGISTDSLKVVVEEKNKQCFKVEDEVVVDSTEDEEICEIVEKESNEEKEVYLINEPNRCNDYSEYEESGGETEQDPYQVLVLPDTDSDTENYLTNVKSRIEKQGFPINETLHLTFEETFFLMYAIGSLQLIHYDGSILSISNAWNHFQQQDQNFIQKYVVYHYFRSKGWVVKPGLKFGGDFLLYKQGPPFYHASYIVIIEVVDADTLLRDDVKSMRKVSWKNLIGLERLSETIAKEILFAQILWPSSIARNGPYQIPVDALSEFTVRQLLWRRWDPKRNRDFASTDDEDSDST